MLGENGAGKSTLIKILSGVHPFDGGSMEIDGRRVAFASPAKSREAGIAVVYQDLSLVDSLSVGANLMLGREPRTRLGFIRKRQLMRNVEEFLQTHGIPLDPRAQVGSLSFAYRQMTEICKALIGKVRILILDEPTSALAGEEEKILFDAIAAATARGVGVIYVTHRLNEVFRVSDRVTVLRDGANAGSFVTSETDLRQLIGAIVGPGHALAKDGAGAGAGEVERPPSRRTLVLSKASNDRLNAVDLTLREGEVRGLAGLVGSGRTEILETIYGLRRLESGDVSLDGVSLCGRSPAEAIRRGVALVPEDRQVQGLVLDHSIERNLTLPRLRHYSRWGWLRRRAASVQAWTSMRRLNVKAPSPSTYVKNLSGGNQQKVVFAKWQEPRPRVLLLDEPTIGVDVGAREEIYDLIWQAARSGTSVLVVSSDLAELLLLCDRISIVVGGGVVGDVGREDVDSAEALHHLVQEFQLATGSVA